MSQSINSSAKREKNVALANSSDATGVEEVKRSESLNSKANVPQTQLRAGRNSSLKPTES